MRVWFRNEVMPITEDILETTLKVIPSTDSNTYDVNDKCNNDYGTFNVSMSDYDYILGWNMENTGSYLAYAFPCDLVSTGRVFIGYTVADA